MMYICIHKHSQRTVNVVLTYFRCSIFWCVVIYFVYCVDFGTVYDVYTNIVSVTSDGLCVMGKACVCKTR